MKIGIAGPLSRGGAIALLGACDPLLPGGYEGAPFLVVLAKEFLRRGHHVSIYTITSDLPLGELGYRKFSGENIEIYFCGARRRAFRLEDGRVGRIVDLFRLERSNLLSAIEDSQPEVIHAHWLYEFALAAVASKKPSVVTIHDSPLKILYYIPTLYRLGKVVMALITLRRARQLTAVSPYVADQVRAIANAKIDVVPNPVEAKASESINSASPVSKNPIVGMIANGWSRHKNIEKGLMAFRELRKVVPGARLAAFGADFGKGERVEAFAKAKNLEKGVEFRGKVAHDVLLLEMQKFSALLHPSLEEACPLTLVEAMSLGVPVVGGEGSGGVPWVLNHGAAGQLTDVTSPTAMCESLCSILYDGSRRESVIDAALQRVEELFSVAKVAEAYEQQYVHAIRSHRIENERQL